MKQKPSILVLQTGTLYRVMLNGAVRFETERLEDEHIFVAGLEALRIGRKS